MFGSDYAKQFGLPGFPWTGLDAQGGFYQPNFSGLEQGQPVPGTPGASQLPGITGTMVGSRPDAGAGPANASVAALTSGSPLATPTAMGATQQLGLTGDPGGLIDQVKKLTGAGMPPAPGPGAPATGGHGV
ncbi:MAG TPA: hypothetical protein VF748_15525 [Candidatus Acidoferrum sp.]